MGKVIKMDSREAYYKGRASHMRERAEYHDSRFEETGNPYHEEQANRLRDEETALLEKAKPVKKKKKGRAEAKDIGPMANITIPMSP